MIQKQQQPEYEEENLSFEGNPLDFDENPEAAPRKSSEFLSTFTFQAILCLCAAITLVLLNTFFPQKYLDIGNAIQNHIERDDGFTKDVQSVWKTVNDFLTKENHRDDSTAGNASDSGILPPAADSNSGTLESAGGQADTPSSEPENAQPDSNSEPGAGGEPTAAGEIVPANATLEPVSYQGNIIHPLGSGYRISSEYGIRTHPITGEQDFHSGLDFAADEGTEIRAISSGTVISAKETNGYGKHVRLQHPDGSISLYAHCSELFAEAGDSIEQGEVIAAVGNTGMSTGPHLHLAFLIDDIFVNPADILEHAGA